MSLFLGCALSIQPTNTPHFSIVAGLSIALFIRFGAIAFPGLVIGVVGFHTLAILQAGDSIAWPVAMALSLVYAGLYLIQAIVAKVLIQLFTPNHGRIEFHELYAPILVISGPVACVISAIITPLLMSSFGLVDPSFVLRTAFVLWASESLGAMFVVPLVLMAQDYRKESLRKRSFTIAAALAFVFITVQVIFLLTSRIEYSRQLAEEEKAADKFAHFLELTVQNVESYLLSARNYYGASQYVDRNEFERFVRPDDDTSFGLVTSISWLPRVNRETSKDFYKEAKKFGVPDFGFYLGLSPDESQKSSTLPDGDFLTVFYMAGNHASDSALGRSVSLKDEEFKGIFERFYAGEVLVGVDQTYKIIQCAGGNPYWIMTPIFQSSKSADSESARQANLEGVLLAEVDLEAVIDLAVQKSLVHADQIELLLGTVGVPGKQYSINWKRVSNSHGLISQKQVVPKSKDARIDGYYRANAGFFGNEFHYKFNFSKTWIAEHSYSLLNLILFLGVVIGLLVSIGLIMILMHSEVVQRQVADRTSELNEAYRKLRISSSQLEALFVAFPDAMIRAAKDGTILSFKAQEISFFFPGVKRILGQKIQEIVDSKYEREFKESIRKISSREVEMEMVEFLVKDPEEDTEKLLEARLTAQGNENVLIVMRDNTALKKLESELDIERQKSIESARLASMGEMAGGIAHEINNPLAIIQGHGNKLLKLLDRKPEEYEAKIEDSAQKIVETVSRIARIIKGLRTVARDGSSDPFESVSLHKLMEEIVDFCGERFKVNDLTLDLDFPDHDVTIDARRVQLMQVFINLINNSFDAIRDLPERWIQIVVREKGENQIELRFIDSGSGITEATALRMFQPFFTTKDVGKGTGLGLSISKSIIDSHNGEFTIDSKHSNTCFVITLPVHQVGTKTVDSEDSNRQAA